MYLLAPLIVQNFKAIARVDPELWPCVIFVPKMTNPFALKNFLGKTINIIFMYFFAPFIKQNF